MRKEVRRDTVSRIILFENAWQMIFFFGLYSMRCHFRFQFFVASNPAISEDRLWHEKYSLRRSMIPKFIKHDQAKKVSDFEFVVLQERGLRNAAAVLYVESYFAFPSPSCVNNAKVTAQTRNQISTYSHFLPSFEFEIFKGL